MFNKKKNNKGFTLVELLVVIAIIGILAIVAVPALFKNINKANAADIVGDIRAIKTSIMAEYSDGKDLSKLTLTNNKDIQNTLSIEDISDKATYSIKATSNPTTAILTVTVDNNTIAERVKGDLGIIPPKSTFSEGTDQGNPPSEGTDQGNSTSGAITFTYDLLGSTIK